VENLTHYPLALFVVSFVVLSAVAVAGAWLRRRHPEADAEHHEHAGIVLAATLTLLGLIIGFTFSMAINRYDQRKNFEEAEANAIGTEMLRADFLPSASAANVRKLLADYTNYRVQFYLNKDDDQRKAIAEKTAKLQAELWQAVRASSAAQPTPVEALALAGMNDVINSQGVQEQDSHRRVVSDGDHRAVFKRAVGLSLPKR
jgi:phosphoribosylanthranilate isomerase